MSSTYPSVGGIGMYLQKAYGSTLPTAFHALLMYCSMVIAQSFLARTFGSYTLQLFDVENRSLLVPLLGVGLLLAAFLINLSANRLIEGVASVLGVIKIGGDRRVRRGRGPRRGLAEDGRVIINSAPGFPVRLSGGHGPGYPGLKGFTTITNSGSELKDPHRNVGRAIMISIALCVVIYALLGFAVASNLSLQEIIKTQDYSLAAAARPTLGEAVVWFTVILATAGGIIASVFAVSRMLAMLTEMRLVPHRHFHMPGSIQKHTLVYTIVLGLLLTAFFDLSRIAALGIIFYLIMDIAIHWGVFRHLRHKVSARPAIPIIAILLDIVVLGGFIWVKATSDPLVLIVAAVVMGLILVGEWLFLSKRQPPAGDDHSHTH